MPTFRIILRRQLRATQQRLRHYRHLLQHVPAASMLLESGLTVMLLVVLPVAEVVEWQLAHLCLLPALAYLVPSGIYIRRPCPLRRAVDRIAVFSCASRTAQLMPGGPSRTDE